MGTIFLLAPLVLGLLVILWVRADHHRRVDATQLHNPIMRAYRQRRFQRFVGALSVVVVGLLVMSILVFRGGPGRDVSPDQATWVRLLLLLVAGLYDWRVWRCPQCHRYLGRLLDPHFCRSCGTRLR